MLNQVCSQSKDAQIQVVVPSRSQARQKQNCIGPAYRYWYPSAYVIVCTQKLGRCGGHTRCIDAPSIHAAIRHI